jgi:hypothetical protein
MSRHHHHKDIESHSACQKTEEHLGKIAAEAYGGAAAGVLDRSGKDKPGTAEHDLLQLPALELTKETPEQQKIAAKKANLEKEYHIKFETAATSDYGDRVREPSLNELEGVEAALKKSRASVLQDGSKSEMRMVFLKDKRPGDPVAQHQSTDSGSRVVMFGHSGWPATEKDVTGDTKNTRNSVSIENQLIHEFGHQAEYAASINPEKMGWKKADGDWARETKDGRLWKFDFDQASKKVYEWYEVDADGKRKEGSTMSNTDMMENSKVKPATDYFTTPKENFAEGIRLYRQGKETREQFEKDDPELAKYISDFDKRELETKLGIDDNHKPLYVRDADGLIVENPESDHVPQSTLSKVLDSIPGLLLPRLFLI